MERALLSVVEGFSNFIVEKPSVAIKCRSLQNTGLVLRAVRQYGESTELMKYCIERMLDEYLVDSIVEADVCELYGIKSSLNKIFNNSYMTEAVKEKEKEDSSSKPAASKGDIEVVSYNNLKKALEDFIVAAAEAKVIKTPEARDAVEAITNYIKAQEKKENNPDNLKILKARLFDFLRSDNKRLRSVANGIMRSVAPSYFDIFDTTPSSSSTVAQHGKSDTLKRIVDVVTKHATVTKYDQDPNFKTLLVELNKLFSQIDSGVATPDNLDTVKKLLKGIISTKDGYLKLSSQNLLSSILQVVKDSNRKVKAGKEKGEKPTYPKSFGVRHFLGNDIERMLDIIKSGEERGFSPREIEKVKQVAKRRIANFVKDYRVKMLNSMSQEERDVFDSLSPEEQNEILYDMVSTEVDPAKRKERDLRKSDDLKTKKITSALSSPEYIEFAKTMGTEDPSLRDSLIRKYDELDSIHAKYFFLTDLMRRKQDKDARIANLENLIQAYKSFPENLDPTKDSDKAKIAERDAARAALQEEINNIWKEFGYIVKVHKNGSYTMTADSRKVDEINKINIPTDDVDAPEWEKPVDPYIQSIAPGSYKGTTPLDWEKFSKPGTEDDEENVSILSDIDADTPQRLDKDAYMRDRIRKMATGLRVREFDKKYYKDKNKAREGFKKYLDRIKKFIDRHKDSNKKSVKDKVDILSDFYKKYHGNEELLFTPDVPEDYSVFDPDFKADKGKKDKKGGDDTPSGETSDDTPISLDAAFKQLSDMFPPLED